MKLETPKLERMTFEFTQDGNCISNKDAFESIIIEAESSLGIDFDKGAFFVLKTRKWSMEPNDMIKLLNRVQSSIDEILKTNSYDTKL